uniref:Cationic amino acid transporter 3, mitochondrial n=1 Tax=Noccaea caerulescens TaxID=107243 RepID=A0A1J3HUU5_NOCCA
MRSSPILVSSIFFTFVVVDSVALKNKKRRKLASWSIISTCVGNFILSNAASSSLPLPGFVRYSICGVGGLLLLVGLIVLSCIDQDDTRHSFGQSGGFVCPCVPVLPVLCILINVYLLINLGAGTWLRVSVWMFIGVVIYLFYGRRNSTLVGAVYVPTAQGGEIL